MRHTVYRHFDADGALLYVGMARDPFRRLTGHAQEASWFDQIATVTISHFNTKRAALNAEADAIDSEGPKHNARDAFVFDPTPEQDEQIRAVWLDETRSLSDRCQGVIDIFGSKVPRFSLYRRYGKPGTPR